MSKSIVFISHITEEAELAQKLKELIENSFLGMIEVFVSSDETSISAGGRWLDDITDSLSNCAIELILCSPKSITRPWINFEAGAGWVRKIPVIPLCHSGMEPSKLPIPLNLLQAAKISEISSFKFIFPVLAQAIEAKIPNVDFTDFVEKVRELEMKYTFWNDCNKYFGYLFEYDNRLISTLKEAAKQTRNIRIELMETDIRQFEIWINDFFEKHNLIKLNKTGSAKMTPIGTLYGCEIIIGSKLNSVLSDKNFKY